MDIRIQKREQIIGLVNAKEMRQSQAAEALGITTRQVKRLCRRVRQEGLEGLSDRRKAMAYNRISEAMKNQVIQLAMEKYVDFGPTFMAEKLNELDGLCISKESVRKILIEAKIWKTKREKKKTIHQRRERRDCLGELVQIDGSPHAWFEERGEKCCLIVFIDDATSRVLYAQFEPVESTLAYLKGISAQIKTYGIPLAYYSDKHMIFHVSNAKSEETNLTQFERACEALGIQGIRANTPQAKGRVERVNRTFQDRLVKELRLANIHTIEAGNQFLQTYLPLHNQKFSVCPKKQDNLHSKHIPDDETLSCILSIQSTRKLSKNLELSFNRKIYQVLDEGKGRRLQQSQVVICEKMDGSIELLSSDGRSLNYQTKAVRTAAGVIVDHKQLAPHLDKLLQNKKSNKPSKHHPWRTYPITQKNPHLSLTVTCSKLPTIRPTQALNQAQNHASADA